MTPTVLYVTYDGLLEPLGVSQVVPYVRALARNGLQMEVVSFEKRRDLGSAREVALNAELAELGIRWHRLPYHGGAALFSTSWDLLAGRALVKKVTQASGVDLIHARSYVAAAMSLPTSRRASIPLVFDMRGFWIDERLEAGRWGRRHPALPIARRLERELLAEATALVHLSEAGLADVSRLGRVGAAHHAVVPTCVDLSRFLPSPVAREFRARNGYDQRPLLVHAGTLSGWYLREETLEVGRAFEGLGGQFVVLSLDREFARSEGQFVGDWRAVEPENMPAWLGAADVGLALVRPTFSKRASMPTRVGEYLASGVAVAATAGTGDLSAHFAVSQVARAFDAPIDPPSIAAWAFAAAKDPDRRQEARALAQRFYDLEIGVARLLALYDAVGVRA